MALIRERRQLNLSLPLPEPTERRPRFTLPLPPAAANCSSSSSSSAAVSASDLERLEVLGHGNGGTVYKVRHKRTGANYALKIVKGDSDPTVRRQLYREIEILRWTRVVFLLVGDTKSACQLVFRPQQIISPPLED
ncbi:hypothetical protein ACLB2K_005908 [Fragaria x ananassa]